MQRLELLLIQEQEVTEQRDIKLQMGERKVERAHQVTEQQEHEIRLTSLKIESEQASIIQAREQLLAHEQAMRDEK